MSSRALADMLLVGGLILIVAAAPATAARRLDPPNPLKGQTATGGVTLSWSNIGGETGYLVERRAAGGSFAEIAKTTSDRTSYTDLVATTASYEYRVRAYRTAPKIIYSDYSNTIASTVADDGGSTAPDNGGSTTPEEVPTIPCE
jgi:hypothetical protein